jgi:hypothetical protein
MPTTLAHTAGRIQQTQYGTNRIGTPARTDGCWERIDTYCGSDGRPVQERRFCAGREDFSDMATGYNGNISKGNVEYHPRCSCCWLGFSHTVELHRLEAVGEW